MTRQINSIIYWAKVVSDFLQISQFNCLQSSAPTPLPPIRVLNYWAREREPLFGSSWEKKKTLPSSEFRCFRQIENIWRNCDRGCYLFCQWLTFPSFGFWSVRECDNSEYNSCVSKHRFFLNQILNFLTLDEWSDIYSDTCRTWYVFK